MRRLLHPPFALIRTLLSTAPLAAQEAAPPTPPDEPGLYGEVGAGFGYSSSLGVLAAGSAAVGYRLPSGLAVGVHAARADFGDHHSALAVGPEARYARPLGANTTLNLHASGTVGLYRGAAFEADGYRLTGLGAEVAGAATRRFGLGRGVTLAATGGLFGGVTHTAEADLAPSFGASRSAGLGAHAGVVVGAQVEFKVLGGRLAVGPYAYVPLVSMGSAPGYGTSAHRAGGGPGRGFVTFTF